MDEERINKLKLNPNKMDVLLVEQKKWDITYSGWGCTSTEGADLLFGGIPELRPSVG